MNGRRLVLAAAVLWGTTGSAQALGPEAATPVTTGALRLVVGAAGLVAVAAFSGTLRRLRNAPLFPLALTALGVAAYQPAFFAGVERAGVAVGTVVAIGSAPVLAGLLAKVAERERLGRRWFVSTALAIAGTVAVVGSPEGADPFGVAAALGAGAAYALYALGAKRVVAVVGATAAMAGGFGLGSILLVPFLWNADLSWVTTGAGAAMVGWLGLVTVTASYLLFGSGLVTTPLSVTGTLSLAEPATATLLGVAALGERPGFVTWAGVAMILVGLGILARPATPP